MLLLRDNMRLRSATIKSLIDRVAMSHGRSQAIVRTALVSMTMRVFSVLASLLTVPLVLHDVGRERYGIWMAAIALSTLFAMADGGITKGLIAEVAKAHGADDRAGIRVLISSALATTTALVAIVLLLVLTAVSAIDWQWAFNLSTPAMAHEADLTISAMCVAYALSFPATVIREARLGLLQGATVNTWDFAGLVAAVLGLLLAVHFHWGLIAIASIWVGIPVIARNASAAYFLAYAGADLRPSWTSVSASASRSLIVTGSVFVVYLITQALAVQSDQILIARFLGADAVAEYSIVQRLFNQPQVLVTLALAAQWPAYGEALGRGDLAWIRSHFSQSLIGYAVIATVGSGVLALFCNDILRVWVGGGMVASQLMITSMAAYAIVATLANVFSFFFMSLSLHRLMIGTQLAMFAVNLPLSIWLLPRVGSAGAIIGTTVGYLVAIVIPGLVLKHRIFVGLIQTNDRINQPK